MYRRQILLSVLIGLSGLVLAAFLLSSTPATGLESDPESPQLSDVQTGPLGGRLFDAGNGRQLEVTIFEAGIPPEFRLFPFVDDEPASPGQLNLTALVSRLGGVVDTLQFYSVDRYLASAGTVYEPHSFSVSISGFWGDTPVSWSFESVEGRIEMSPDVAAASGVSELIAGPSTITSSFQLPGEIHLNEDRVALVAPRVSGTVVEIRVKLGDHVSVGDVLAVFESRELGDAKRDYIGSLHALELAQANYERERQLYDRGVSTRKEYDIARHGLEEAELEQQMAEQALAALGLVEEELEELGIEPEGLASMREVRDPLPSSLTRYELKAPMEGQVLERNLLMGQYMESVEYAVMTADLSTVWVEISVYASDLNKASSGQKVVVRERNGAGVEAVGRINYIGPVLGEATRAARALVTLANDGRWRPGMFVSAELLGQQQGVSVAVDRQAIQIWREMPVVFARFGDFWEVRPVKLGRMDDESVEILSGLASGQAYAAEGSYILKAELEKSGASHDH